MEVLWRRSDLVEFLACAAAINCAGSFAAKLPGSYFTTADNALSCICKFLCNCTLFIIEYVPGGHVGGVKQ